MKIGFTFTNYNNSQFTIDCIKSIHRNLGEGTYKIVVVDNNSNDADKAMLSGIEPNYEHVKIIFNKENSGYFNGLNIGIDQLRNSEFAPDYIIIGNNDLVFEAEFYAQMEANVSILNSYAVVSPNIITIDGIHQNPHVIKRISAIREIIYDLYYSNYYASLAIAYLARLTKRITDRPDELQHELGQEIYQGYGACYILGPKFFDKFEQLWAPTFLMGEELFLSLQLKKQGLSIYYEPNITVIHHDHASLDKLPSKKLWQISKVSHKEYRKHVKFFNSTNL